MYYNGNVGSIPIILTLNLVAILFVVYYLFGNKYLVMPVPKSTIYPINIH